MSQERKDNLIGQVQNVDVSSARQMLLVRIGWLTEDGRSTPLYGTDETGLLAPFLSGGDARSDAEHIDAIESGRKDPCKFSIRQYLRLRAIHLVDQNPKRNRG